MDNPIQLKIELRNNIIYMYEKFGNFVTITIFDNMTNEVIELADKLVKTDAELIQCIMTQIANLQKCIDLLRNQLPGDEPNDKPNL